ncbi:MAG: heparinase II/III family protein [Rhodobacterales bacterium]|jgi:hypothetical protein
MATAILLRAITRLSPRMAAYQVKRLLRNRLAAWFPGAYAAHIRRIALSLPELTQPSDAAVAMAQDVAAFYHDEYLPVIEAAASGTFTFFGKTVAFGSVERIDWHHTIPAETDFHLWRMKLGHMGFACPMLMSGGPEHVAAVVRIIQSYRANSSFAERGCFSSYWFPYSVSHRILAMLSGLVLARDRLPPDQAATITEFLRENAAFVLANIEHDIRNNHVERNLAALCLYFTCTDTVPAAVKRRLDRDVREIVADTILPDGLQGERSAMYQGLSVMALRVFAATPFLSEAARDLSARRLVAAERAWALMIHPDGDIALFNDSWFGEVPHPGRLVAEQALGPLEVLPDAGYARLHLGRIFALFDAGPIGLRWNPGHGHADFLSAEVDVAGRRFLVDPGTFQYSTGPRRKFERASGSHNGPDRAGVEPVEYSGCFKVGAMSAARLTGAESREEWVRVSGELALGSGSMTRSLEVTAERIDIEDRWNGMADGAQVRLIVPGEWRLETTDSCRAIFVNDKERVQICVERGTIASVEAGNWACRYLDSEAATHLVLTPEDEGRGAALVWSVGTAGRSVP